MKLLFKICSETEWATAREKGIYFGSQADLADGFIHLSAAHQVRETAVRHFAGQQGLVLLAVNEAELGSSLTWERSRGGDLFPHIYGPMPTHAVLWAKPLSVNHGTHVFPDLSE